MLRILIITICFTHAFISSGQEFYDINTVHKIEITFAQSNWDSLMDAQKAGDEDYIQASEVLIDGVSYDSIGVKYKGNSTYSANRVKNGLHIELDTYKDHDHQGYTDIKLSNGYKDPSMIREVLSYSVIRQYMDAPLSNYAEVYINGTLIGLYSNSESISKKFVNSRFGSKSNTFVKCNPINGAGPQSSALPDLVYMGQDTADYYESYEIKSDGGWQNLIDLCDTLNNQVSEIESVLDVDKVLWMLALNNVLVNLDSYIGQFTQNYYLYENDYGQFMPVIWDLNESIGVFSSTGSGNLNSTAQKQQMDHLLHINDSDFPLVSQLLQNARYKKMYLAHMKTILIENFDNGNYEVLANQLQDLVGSYVQDDPNGFFTYNEFLSNLNADVNSGNGPMGSRAPGITTLMDGRSSYLLGLSDFTAVQPDITDVNISIDQPLLNEEVIVTAVVDNADAVYYYYRINEYAPFVGVEMFDDGTHDDGIAGDGIYGSSLVVNSINLEYYVYAENSAIGSFSPARAAHEYYNIELGSPEAGDLVINEFMASNDETVADQDGDFDDWIELYNNSTEEIDLSGYLLSDNFENIGKYSFPDGTTIGGGEYLIVWADEDEDQEGLHANFKLSSGGESIYLSDADTMLLDQITYGEQETDVSFGRFPNGIGEFQSMPASFGAENLVLTSINEVELEPTKVDLYPNPVVETITIASTSALEMIRIFDVSGKLLYKNTANGNKLQEVNVSDFQSGLLILQYTDIDGGTGAVRFVKL